MNQKILIIRFSSIGDIVLTTPVIRCLKQQLPDAEIHYVTKSQYAGILQNNPYISKVHILDKSALQTGLRLHKENFTSVIDLHNNLRSIQLRAAIDAPYKAFDKLNPEKFIQVNFKANVLPNIHIVDRYFATVAHLGVTNDGLGLDYFIPALVRPENINTINLLANPFIAWAVGAQHFTKRLPAQNIIAHIQKLRLPVYLLGGKEDNDIASFIEQETQGKAKNLCGKLSLDESACVVKHAQEVYTNDTGLMHIAAAFKKPIVSFWGNTIPEFGMTPYYGTKGIENKRLEAFPIINQVTQLSCRPCSKIGYNKCPKGHFNCMNSL